MQPPLSSFPLPSGWEKEELSQRATVTGRWLLCQVLKVPETVAQRHKITITQLIAAFQ